MTTGAHAVLVDAVGDRLAPGEVEALASEIEKLLAAERSRCAALCRQRMELWRNTALARSDMPAAREEARARANEAQYLADLLEPGR